MQSADFPAPWKVVETPGGYRVDFGLFGVGDDTINLEQIDATQGGQLGPKHHRYQEEYTASAGGRTSIAVRTNPRRIRPPA